MTTPKLKIKKGDTVQMLSGKDRGKRGKVLRTDPQSGRVIVEGLNMVKRHLRRRANNQKGQIIAMERWVSAASVAFVSKESDKPTRLGWQVSSEGVKTRIDRKTGTPV
jgi:large subunit ribosomal protein L24